MVIDELKENHEISIIYRCCCNITINPHKMAICQQKRCIIHRILLFINNKTILIELCLLECIQQRLKWNERKNIFGPLKNDNIKKGVLSKLRRAFSTEFEYNRKLNLHTNMRTYRNLIKSMPKISYTLIWFAFAIVGINEPNFIPKIRNNSSWHIEYEPQFSY